jgi:hypothetical protein
MYTPFIWVRYPLPANGYKPPDMQLIDPDKSVVVVGNGPSVMHQPLGKLIDCFENVVRFNQCRTAGIEEYAGSKSTIWCTFGRGILPGDEHIRPEKVIMVHEKGKPAYKPKYQYRIESDFYWNIARELQSISTYPQPEKVIPSSGYLVLRWLLDVHQAKVVHVTGMDHFKKEQDKRHHYWNPQHFGRPKEHDGDQEARLLETYIKTQRLFYLNK